MFNPIDPKTTSVDTKTEWGICKAADKKTSLQ